MGTLSKAEISRLSREELEQQVSLLSMALPHSPSQSPPQPQLWQTLIFSADVHVEVTLRSCIPHFGRPLSSTSRCRPAISIQHHHVRGGVSSSRENKSNGVPGQCYLTCAFPQLQQAISAKEEAEQEADGLRDEIDELGRAKETSDARSHIHLTVTTSRSSLPYEYGQCQC